MARSLYKIVQPEANAPLSVNIDPTNVDYEVLFDSMFLAELPTYHVDNSFVVMNTEGRMLFIQGLTAVVRLTMSLDMMESIGTHMVQSAREAKARLAATQEMKQQGGVQ